jgi:hypothetical protein
MIEKLPGGKAGEPRHLFVDERQALLAVADPYDHGSGVRRAPKAFVALAEQVVGMLPGGRYVLKGSNRAANRASRITQRAGVTP